LAKIASRDYFGAPLGNKVRAERDQARAVLQAFEAAALAADTDARATAGAGRGSGSSRGGRP